MLNHKDNDSLLIPVDWEEKGAIIKIIGIGGGGNNAVNNMFHMGIEGVNFVVCNTDAQALSFSPIDIKIQLGSKGLGAGCDPEKGRQAALESMDKIQEILDNNTQMLFLTAGMGGGTGTGATPVIAEMAKSMGILTIAIVTMPFTDEGVDFRARACEGIRKLQEHVDSLLVINNDRLYKCYGKLPLKKAFAKVDEVLTTAAKGISEIVSRYGDMNVDLADVRRAMENSNVAIMGAGSASGEGRALQAVKEALSSPLLDNNDISDAKSLLINFTASDENFMSDELEQAMDYIQERSGRKAGFVKRGVVYDRTLGDTLHATVIATGFRMQTLIDAKPPLTSCDETNTALTYDECPEKNNIINIDTEEKTQPENEEYDITVSTRRKVLVDHTTLSGRGEPVPKLKSKPALIIDNDSAIMELTRIPAYIRRKVNIGILETNRNDSHPAASTLTKTPTGEHCLNTENNYLYKNLD